VVTREQLEHALGLRCTNPMSKSAAPGTLEVTTHRAPVALDGSQEMKEALQVLPATIKGLAVYSRTATRHRWCR
jgi:hypothetical protein